MCTNNQHMSQEISQCPFLTPKTYIYSGYERNRFEAYQQGLLKETDILEVWRWYGNDYFHFDLNAYLDVMNMFLPNNVDGFAKHCNMLRAPVILHEIFAHARNAYGQEDCDNSILLEFMSKAPVCANQNEKGGWEWDGNSFAAPVMLDFLFNIILQDNPINKELDEKRVIEFTQKIGRILLMRDDGYFLVWNYTKYLLSSNKKNQDAVALFIETIGQVCSPLVKNYYGEQDWLKALRPKGFTLKDNRERFAQTGLLGITGKESMYLNLLTQMQFSDQTLDTYLPCFEDNILLEDDMFKAFSAKPLLCHYYISDIYIATEDPVASWKSSWEKMRPALHRIWFNRYDELSISIERNINFLLIVGIAMVEQLCSNIATGDFEKGDCLCENLLNVLNTMMNTMGDKVSQLNREMLNYLVTLQFIFAKARSDAALASSKTINYILNNNWQPRHILEILSTLKANGFQPNLQYGNEQADEFCKKIIWVTECAKAQKKCEYKLATLGEDIQRWTIAIRKKTSHTGRNANKCEAPADN